MIERPTSEPHPAEDYMLMVVIKSGAEIREGVVVEAVVEVVVFLEVWNKSAWMEDAVVV